MTAAFWKLWAWPIALGLLSVGGLVGGLVADGWGDAWAWIGLGIPVLVLGWHLRRHRASPHRITAAGTRTPGRPRRA